VHLPVIFILLQKIQKMAKCRFRYRLTRVVPDKAAKRLCVCCVLMFFQHNLCYYLPLRLQFVTQFGKFILYFCKLDVRYSSDIKILATLGPYTVKDKSKQNHSIGAGSYMPKCPTCHQTNSAKVPKKTQATDCNQS